MDARRQIAKTILMGVVLAAVTSLSACGRHEDVAPSSRPRARRLVRDDVKRPRRPPTAHLDRHPFRPLEDDDGPTDAPEPTPSRHASAPAPRRPIPRNSGDAHMPQPVTVPGDDEEQPPEEEPTEAQACKISVAGVVRGHDGFRVLVQDGASGDTLWASVGDTVFGYEVELITSRGALVRKDSRNYVLQIGGKASKATDDEEEPETEEDSSEDDATDEETKSADGDERFYGTWTATMSEGGMNVTISLTFRSDHTGSMSAMGQGEDFTWSVTGDSLDMGELSGSSTEDVPFRFEEGGDVLVLEQGPGGEEMRFEKE